MEGTPMEFRIRLITYVAAADAKERLEASAAVSQPAPAVLPSSRAGSRRHSGT